MAGRQSDKTTQAGNSSDDARRGLDATGADPGSESASASSAEAAAGSAPAGAQSTSFSDARHADTQEQYDEDLELAGTAERLILQSRARLTAETVQQLPTSYGRFEAEERLTIPIATRTEIAELERTLGDRLGDRIQAALSLSERACDGLLQLGAFPRSLEGRSRSTLRAAIAAWLAAQDTLEQDVEFELSPDVAPGDQTAPREELRFVVALSTKAGAAEATLLPEAGLCVRSERHFTAPDAVQARPDHAAGEDEPQAPTAKSREASASDSRWDAILDDLADRNGVVVLPDLSRKERAEARSGLIRAAAKRGRSIAFLRSRWGGELEVTRSDFVTQPPEHVLPQSQLWDLVHKARIDGAITVVADEVELTVSCSTPLPVTTGNPTFTFELRRGDQRETWTTTLETREKFDTLRRDLLTWIQRYAGQQAQPPQAVAATAPPALSSAGTTPQDVPIPGQVPAQAQAPESADIAPPARRPSGAPPDVQEFRQETETDSLRANPAGFLSQVLFDTLEPVGLELWSALDDDDSWWMTRTYNHVRQWWERRASGTLALQLGASRYTITRSLDHALGLPILVQRRNVETNVDPLQIIRNALYDLVDRGLLRRGSDDFNHIFNVLQDWLLTDREIIDVEIGGKTVEFRFLFDPVATIDVSVENIYSAKTTDVILGLEAKVRELGEDTPAGEVLRAVERYKDPSVPLSDASQLFLRFLALGAYTGALDGIERHRVSLLLDYYFRDDLDTIEVARRAGFGSRERMRDLLTKTTESIWRNLPEHVPAGSPWKPPERLQPRENAFPLSALHETREAKGTERRIAALTKRRADGNMREAMREMRARNRHSPVRRGGAA